MAHELTLRADGKAEMAFAGDKTPWHGLGQSVTKGASIGVWTKEAGMDWEALEGTPGIITLDSVHKGLEGTIDFPDYKALYRSDTKAPLAIVGAGYNVLQPRACMEFMREVVEGEAGWFIHTAGTLRGGRKLWVMASNDQRGRIGKKGDTIVNNLLLATSLDGSMKTTVADTSVTVVCANTLAMALRSNDGIVQISHRSVFDGAAVRRAIGLADGSFDAFLKTARELADTPIDVKEATTLLNDIFGNGQPKKPDLSWMDKITAAHKQPSAEEAANRATQRVLALFQGDALGADLAGRSGTRWGLLNAVTEHVDHDMGRTDDTRLDSAWFGRGAGFKKAVFEALTA